ncbi:hypothetical protein T05_8190 [Trichinella murrelli]|uniref:Reverse transcriptase/retrotransposon-derived protein RNase H-like domain-containing protein n=1 Tax=Trichinella murrelli TaxID=144512 RepID=A0A0V0T5H9_9BILA|nr:hypothetical protein T05_6981 [Trichinella murrelli]KRX34254.1 hypothetical protein T05_10088 [Trichinella murrelli]KRX34348.1 hypothetical protein T05_10298 [Trichinella murrelli]KRX34709.1 hypothetical protein T05_2317 [Trichinella murrelli]KRX35631.1 hypothetical protein T05_8190 [Trichinella murrelli]
MLKLAKDSKLTIFESFITKALHSSSEWPTLTIAMCPPLPKNAISIGRFLRLYRRGVGKSNDVVPSAVTAITVDASGAAIGAVLEQLINNSWQPHALFSRQLTDPERKCSDSTGIFSRSTCPSGTFGATSKTDTS